MGVCHSANHSPLTKLCHDLTIPEDLNAFSYFADSLFDPLSQMMEKMILRSTMILVKMRFSYLKSVYSVSDLEFKDRIFYALEIANTYFL